MSELGERMDNKQPIYINLDVDAVGYCLHEGKIIKITVIELSIKRYRIKDNNNIQEKINYICELFNKPKNGGLFSVGKEEGTVFRTQEELFNSIKLK